MLSLPFLEKILKEKKYAKVHHRLTDSVDRLHFIITVTILGFFAVLIGTKQHFGQPIDCWMPAQVAEVKPWAAYVVSYCFMYGTYRFNSSTNSTRFDHYKNSSSVNYYQWVPFFLGFQLVCFCLPHWFWSWLQGLLYLDMGVIVSEARSLTEAHKQIEVSEKINKVADYVHDYFQYRKFQRTNLFACCFRHPAIACIFYLITKLLFLANVLLQLYLVMEFLGVGDSIVSYEKLTEFLTFTRTPGHANLTVSRYFPSHVVCDYHMNAMDNNLVNRFHRETIQCFLPLNVINEKVFTFLWIWFAVLSALTFMNIVTFSLSMMSKTRREEIILDLFKGHSDINLNSPYRRDTKADFVHSFLGADGVLLFKFMSAKAGSMRTSEILLKVWLKYAGEHHLQNQLNRKINMKRSDTGDYSEFNFGDDEVPLVLK